MSYAIANIKKYQSRQRAESIKAFLYIVVEALTALSIFAFAFAYYSIIN